VRAVALVAICVVVATGAPRGAAAAFGADAGAGAAVPVRLAVENDVDEGTGFTSTRLIEGLSSTAVLDVSVEGFESFASAVAEQCLVTTVSACANRLPVQFDGDGRARFQYLVRDDFRPGTGGCAADAPRCVVVVRALESDHRAEVVTLFHDRLPPPGELEVDPASGLADGRSVRVAVAGLPAGAAVAVTTCVAPAVEGAARCGAPAATEHLVIGPDGTVATDLTVTSGPIGADGLRCGGEQRCAIVVIGDSVAVRAPVLPITFALPPGSDYDPARLAAGLSLAAALLAVAVVLLRRTDWSAVGEAAAPEIDDAEYADLDAIVAALPPEPEDLEVTSPRRPRAPRS